MIKDYQSDRSALSQILNIYGGEIESITLNFKLINNIDVKYIINRLDFPFIKKCLRGYWAPYEIPFTIIAGVYSRQIVGDPDSYTYKRITGFLKDENNGILKLKSRKYNV